MPCLPIEDATAAPDSESTREISVRRTSPLDVAAPTCNSRIHRGGMCGTAAGKLNIWERVLSLNEIGEEKEEVIRSPFLLSLLPIQNPCQESGNLPSGAFFLSPRADRTLSFCATATAGYSTLFVMSALFASLGSNPRGPQPPAAAAHWTLMLSTSSPACPLPLVGEDRTTK